MPKERIYGRREQTDATTAFDVSVQWDKADDRPGVHQNDGDGYEGHVSLALVPQTEAAPVAVCYLDRTALNRLVSAARRARSAAYGADE